MSIDYFNVNDYTIETLQDRKPNFGYDGFGEAVFYRTYSRMKGGGKNENWADVVLRVINGVMTLRKTHYVRNHINWDQEYWERFSHQMALSLFDMKWLPPGRGLWAMGTDFVYERGSMSLYNCFSGDTRFFNNGKIETLQDNVNKTVIVNTIAGFKTATVQQFGKQNLCKITLKPRYGKSNYRLTYMATKNHRWILSNDEQTTSLKKGDVLKIKPGSSANDNTEDYRKGLIHGMVFADGTKISNDTYRLELFGWKDKYAGLVASSQMYQTTQESNNGLILKTSTEFKAVPREEHSIDYKQGFLDGWKLFDGHVNATNYCIDTIDQKAKDWLCDHAGFLDYVVVGCSVVTADSNYGSRKPLYRIKLKFESVDFIVEDFVELQTEVPVYCVVEPETKTFQLAGGMITGNCAFTLIKNETFGEDIEWLMDSLMMGVGVGFEAVREEFACFRPIGHYTWIIPDTREGWARSVRLLIDAYAKPGQKLPVFVYDQLRKRGELIRGFGGQASGPEPLIYLHKKIMICFQRYLNEQDYDIVRLKTDIANLVGCCVVAGNVRRSAELALGSIDDPTFMDLKDYDKYPDRAEFGWMSNNTAKLYKDEDFERLRFVAERVPIRGEPGIANLRNFPVGRTKKRKKYPSGRKDKAIGLNP